MNGNRAHRKLVLECSSGGVLLQSLRVPQSLLGCQILPLWSHLWGAAVANGFCQMPVGLAPTKCSSDFRRQLLKYFTSCYSGERCQLWFVFLGLIALCLLFRGHDYRGKELSSGFHGCVMRGNGTWEVIWGGSGHTPPASEFPFREAVLIKVHAWIKQ